MVGGNTFYLLYHARKSEFDRLVKEWVQAGKLYIGSSAGSMIVGPTIDFKGDVDDEYKYLCDGNYDAFGLVDFAIFPHYNNSEHKENTDHILAESKEAQYSMISLRDSQAVMVKGKDYDIVGLKSF